MPNSKTQKNKNYHEKEKEGKHEMKGFVSTYRSSLIPFHYSLVMLVTPCAMLYALCALIVHLSPLPRFPVSPLLRLSPSANYTLCLVPYALRLFSCCA